MKETELFTPGRPLRVFACALVFLLTTTAARSAEPVTIRSSYAAVSGAFASIWIAQDKGLFGKYGINVDLKYILPATATQSLIANSLDICNPGGELIEAGLAGHDVVFMLGVLNRAVFSLYSKPELKSFADLKGKVIGVTQPGSTTDFVARIRRDRPAWPWEGIFESCTSTAFRRL